MPTEINIEAVQQFRGFQDLNAWEAGVVARLLEEVSLEPGSALFRQGEVGDAAFLLVEGAVDVRVSVPGHVDRRLAQLEAGSILGEIALLLEEPRTASVISVGAARLWRLERSALETALVRGDSWAIKFLRTTARTLASRVTAVNQELVQVLSEEREATTTPRTAELMDLRRRLFEEWSF